MDRLAMAHEVGMGCHERLERRRDRKEVDVGDEAVDAGIDAGRLRTMNIAVRGHKTGQHLKVNKSARISLVGRVAADALVVIALRVVRPGLVETCRVDLRML